MKISTSARFVGIKFIVVAKADFNGLLRIPRSSEPLKLSDLPELITIGNDSPAHVSCIICDDRESRGQRKRGDDCATDTTRINKKCDKSGTWTRKKYCRLSCFNAGNGYPGDVCCNGTTPPPTPAPATERPTKHPSGPPTSSPTSRPTASPIPRPSGAPTTVRPTAPPTGAPSPQPTGVPTSSPTPAPSDLPSSQPTEEPTARPTNLPTTGIPTKDPTPSPTDDPTNAPTSPPTKAPSSEPTVAPTGRPSGSPTDEPLKPTNLPTTGTPPKDPAPSPTNDSTDAPTSPPTKAPSSEPTIAPTGRPSGSATDEPTLKTPTKDLAPSHTSTPATPSPTSTTCIICNDAESAWQAARGFDCATDTTRIAVRCNKDETWTKYKYCRLSCFIAGNGYPGDECCNGTPTNDPTAKPLPAPTDVPTEQLTRHPSDHPTFSPRSGPTASPTLGPTGAPTTSQPTHSPIQEDDDEFFIRQTVSPTAAPTQSTLEPTNDPTAQPTNTLITVGKDGIPEKVFPLAECRGDCDSDEDCQGTMVCYQRYAYETVPGCSGDGAYRKDYCAYRAPNYLFYVGQDMGPGALGVCEGDCNTNEDCAEGLVCFDRRGYTPVPGCDGTGRRGTDYCHAVGSLSPSKSPTPEPTKSTLEPTNDPTAQSTNPLVIAGKNGIPEEVFPLAECRGDCDSDGDCQGTMVCYQRYAYETVPGCSGDGAYRQDYCAYRAPNYLFYVGQDMGPGALGVCEGDCDIDEDCAEGLVCFRRTKYTPVPGCDGTGRRSTDYCYAVGSLSPSKTPTPEPTKNPTTYPPTTGQPTKSPIPAIPTASPSKAPTDQPTSHPTKNPSPPPTTAIPTPLPTTPSPANTIVTYVPGELTVPCERLVLSTGMACKLLTERGKKVQLADGTESSDRMHSRADGAGVVPHPSDGGWYYLSNSEVNNGNGGVGSLRFNANGEVIGYQRVLTETSRNCGGGVTYWDTWVSCEENGKSGHCYEVDPVSGYTSRTKAVPNGGNYESFAFDDQDPISPRFFITEDIENGKLVRYTPHPDAFTTGNPYDILSTDSGVYEYLVLDDNDMTFSWSTSITEGEDNAALHFPFSEGIDVHNRILNFVSKRNKELFTLDLAAEIWTVTTTLSGAFDVQPDQVSRIIGDSNALYFCEDGGSDSDIHGRDGTGQFFTVVKNEGYDDESTGLAFSPDGMFMYVAYQKDAHVYAFWRTDGMPFDATVAEIKYH